MDFCLPPLLGGHLPNSSLIIMIKHLLLTKIFFFRSWCRTAKNGVKNPLPKNKHIIAVNLYRLLIWNGKLCPGGGIPSHPPRLIALVVNRLTAMMFRPRTDILNLRVQNILYKLPM